MFWIKKKKVYGITEPLILWFPALTNFFKQPTNSIKPEDLLRRHTHFHPGSYSVFLSRRYYTFFPHFVFVLSFCNELIFFVIRNLFFNYPNNHLTQMPRETQSYFAENQYKKLLERGKKYITGHMWQSNKFHTLNLEGQL